METNTTTELSIEERVARLEGAIGWTRAPVPLKKEMFYAGAAISLVALVLCFIGLGLPNHYYQFIFAVLTILLAHHQGWLARPTNTLQWALSAIDALIVSMLFKLVIGSGTTKPFFWAKVPSIASETSEKAFGVVPTYALTWQESALSMWSIDLTIVQTFLLLVTLLGALFEFQPFASLTAFLLVLVSIPALVGFDWPWVFPAVIATGVALYVQTTDCNVE